MERIGIVKKYISNFVELNPITQKRLLDDMRILNNSILRRLIKQIDKGKKSYVIILSKNRKLTDIPEWSHLKRVRYKNHPIYGTHPFYKTFDEVRGWGGNPTVIGEEWILAKDKNIFNVVRHEIVHQIHANVLSRALCKRIHAAYLSAKRKNSFIRKNSSVNDAEYFADGVVFYFNSAKSKKINVYDMNEICNRDLLYRKDIILYNIVEDIFKRKRTPTRIS